MGKSQAKKEFEERLADLEGRIERGDGTLEQVREAFEKIQADSIPRMTEAERAELQKIKLRGHQIIADLSAKSGRPIPGNDPRRPN